VGSERRDEWVIVLEFVPGSAGAPIDYDTVHDVVDELRAWQPTGLFAPDRYALQLRVPADQPMAALRRGLALHRRAVDSVGAPAPVLARIEVLTTAEFDRQWDDFSGRRAGAAQDSTVLTNDVYWATRSLLRAATPSQVTNILVGFVLAVGGEIDVAAPDGRPDKVVVDLTTDECEPLYATADAVSVPGLIVEQSLPALVADSRAVVARLRQVDHANDLPQPPA
jgi:hypothetical protein